MSIAQSRKLNKFLLVGLCVMLSFTILFSSSVPAGAFLEVLSAPEIVPLFGAFLAGLGIAIDGLTSENWEAFADWSLDALQTATGQVTSVPSIGLMPDDTFQDVLSSSAVSMIGSNFVLSPAMSAIFNQAAVNIQAEGADNVIISGQTYPMGSVTLDGVKYPVITSDISNPPRPSGNHGTYNTVLSYFTLSDEFAIPLVSRDGTIYTSYPDLAIKPRLSNSAQLEIGTLSSGGIASFLYNGVTLTPPLVSFIIYLSSSLYTILPYTTTSGTIAYAYSKLSGTYDSPLPAPPGSAEGGLSLDPTDSIPAPVPSTWLKKGSTTITIPGEVDLTDVSGISSALDKVKEAAIAGEIDLTEIKTETKFDDEFEQNDPDINTPALPWPVGGAFLGIWHYVVQALEDSAAGIAFLFSTIYTFFPAPIVNMCWACIVLALMFGIYQKFIK